MENAALANEEVCLGPAEFTMGSSEPNLGGTYADLAGNAWEWVFDRASSYYASASQPQQDPTGPEAGSTRIQRGGSWLTLANGAVSYARRGESPATTAAVSFRCARGGS